MPHIKKTVAMFLVSALLWGWAWYLNTTSGIGGISSSVLNTSTFVCTEQGLKSQASVYRKTVTRHKKALVIKKKLEAEIELLKKSDPNNQLQKKEETLKLLARQINTYLRFIKKYETCKKEIKLNPAVSSGIMSGEAKVTVSQKEYQALAAFKVSSPKGLNTYVRSIQFSVDILPDLWIVADKWFLLHEGSGPILCQISSDAELIDCELSGDMPVDIMSGMTRTYWIGAHITALHWSGTIDIQISKISFNESRTNADTKIQSPLLSFGVVVPVVEEVRVPTQVTTPSVLTVEETLVQIVTTPPTSSDTTTAPATTETSNPAVPTSSESTTPVPSEETPPVETTVIQPVVTDETSAQTTTTPPTSSDTTTAPATTETSNPAVPTSSESTTPVPSETPPPVTSETV